MSKALASVGKVSKPGARWTASRRIQSGNRAATRRHNYQVGEVLHAFNTAQANFFLIFWRLAADTDIYYALELWEGQATDHGKRQILEIHVRHKLKRKAIQKSVLWALAAMNELTKRRNDAVHSDVSWYYDRLVPGLGTKRVRAERLEEAPLSSFWHDLRGDLSAIANYIDALQLDISADNAWPSTKRPQLKLVRSTSARKQAQRRQAKKTARERQRKASQA